MTTRADALATYQALRLIHRGVSPQAAAVRVETRFAGIRAELARRGYLRAPERQERATMRTVGHLRGLYTDTEEKRAKEMMQDQEPRRPTQVKEQGCIRCGYVFTDAERPADPHDRAAPGDLTLCIRCAKLQIFTEDLGTRELTAAEWADIVANHPQVLAEIAKIERAIYLTNAGMN